MKLKKAIFLMFILMAPFQVTLPANAESAMDKQELKDPTTVTVIYLNSSQLLHNGSSYSLSRITTVKKGVTYVSLRSLSESLGYTVSYSAQTKETRVNDRGIKAAYLVNSNTYQVNGDPQVMKGAAYADHGVLMVPLTSLIAAFQIPYTLQGNQILLNFLTPGSASSSTAKNNEAPKAYFTTDKDQYRIGEPVSITDKSTDDEDAIVNRKWENNDSAFFEAGIVEIKLEVTDQRGLSNEYRKQIEITPDILYTKDEYAKRFTPVGNTFEINGKSVLSYTSLPYQYTTEPYILFRASGPETVNSEGILYQDTISGPTRFMIHHKNNLTTKARFYLIAHNNNDTAASIHIQNEGIAGPSPYPELSGRLAGARYLQSTITENDQQSLQLAAGESTILFNKLNSTAAAPGDVVSMNADLVSDSPIQYTMLMVHADQEPLEAISTLPDLDPHESIVRGTFADSTRIFNYDGIVGDEAERLPLTDNTTDPFQEGMDGLQNRVAINSGNYGVMYKIILNHVAPDTVISFNPRGGRYFGSARVNQDIVDIKHSSDTQNSASVLYRTQSQEEKVEIWLSPAPGSNLPFSLLFLPISEAKK
ncbi:hypothetical protein J23TS9_23270 [Paenibacillus sp. J23TS9]|uniref:stalk domain-containing protein n=1 Tax=Paenibacillus sp. J23TS9 TaxID=2807193 RepID=UPI001B07BB5C|nr:stalk domain-containing protein [Paenibacillus sp. J23TS9]GIP27197.1 hypothetical protein J23TS9_23270 [Paenibacillus sp. J23TS9]